VIRRLRKRVLGPRKYQALFSVSTNHPHDNILESFNGEEYVFISTPIPPHIEIDRMDQFEVAMFAGPRGNMSIKVWAHCIKDFMDFVEKSKGERINSFPIMISWTWIGPDRSRYVGPDTGKQWPCFSGLWYFEDI
jgi:hypothetical protein